MPRDVLLAAAEAAFSGSDTPDTISMDDVAEAAGVGKATLFRAFGSRDGLLDALFASKLATLRAETERSGSPLGPDEPAIDRVTALLGLLLAFKLDNARLVAARETHGASLLAAPHYRWVHRFLRGVVESSGRPSRAADTIAHLLLNALRAEVLAALLADGMSREDIAGELTDIARRLLRP